MEFLQHANTTQFTLDCLEGMLRENYTLTPEEKEQYFASLWNKTPKLLSDVAFQLEIMDSSIQLPRTSIVYHFLTQKRIAGEELTEEQESLLKNIEAQRSTENFHIFGKAFQTASKKLQSVELNSSLGKQLLSLMSANHHRDRLSYGKFAVWWIMKGSSMHLFGMLMKCKREKATKRKCLFKISRKNLKNLLSRS